jgi:hypothetical protein
MVSGTCEEINNLAQRSELNNCFIFFVDSAHLRLCARCPCLKVNCFSRSRNHFSPPEILVTSHIFFGILRYGLDG